MCVGSDVFGLLLCNPVWDSATITADFRGVRKTMRNKIKIYIKKGFSGDEKVAHFYRHMNGSFVARVARVFSFSLSASVFTVKEYREHLRG